jgi:predicted RNase H-like nuclease (RuvC/YqgF family)
MSGNDPPSPTSHAPKGGAKELSREAQRGIRSLEKRIAEHEDKLADFKANPTARPGMEGQPREMIEAAQQSRIRHLEKEIQTFKENIEKLGGGH